MKKEKRKKNQKEKKLKEKFMTVNHKWLSSFDYYYRIITKNTLKENERLNVT